MRRRVFQLAAVAVAVGAVSACGSSGKRSGTSGTRPLSGPLVGVMFNGPVLGSAVNLDRQLDLAVSSGVESLRIPVDWAADQPFKTMSEVPAAWRGQFVDANGVPTRFSDLDRLVGAAAARRLSVLPVVEYTPRWDALNPGTFSSPPKSTAPYAAFLKALTGRYGPGGTFWSAHPQLPHMPIRMWQIWNEPNFTTYWSEQPFAQSYVKLLAAARAAVKRADPGAKVVLAGFADYSWQYLTEIYRVPGASRLFDIAALHPYTAQAGGVIVILQRDRAVMDRFGDRNKPILATEITWPSSQGKAPPQFGVSTTEAQQAQRLGQLMPLLAASRTKLGLMGFYWYTWMGDESPSASLDAFNFAGLLKYVRGAVTAKPALAVFKRWALSIEGCRSKASGVRCGGS